MSRPEPPSFHLRLPPELKAKLERTRGEKSLNREIVERLERSFGEDIALQFGEVLRPHMASLGDTEQREMIDLARRIADLVLTVRQKALKPSGRKNNRTM